MEEFLFKDELLYLMNYVIYYIDELINNVLEDSESDPHYSAVTAQNMLLSYIAVMNELRIALPYNDIAGYFLDSNHTESEYQLFEKKRSIESSYYVGKQLRQNILGQIEVFYGTGDGSVC